MNRFRSKAYLDYVRGLPCCNCGSQSHVEAHYIKGRGHLSGAGLTAPDTWAMPLCWNCYVKIHKGDKEMLDSQFEWVGKDRDWETTKYPG